MPQEEEEERQRAEGWKDGRMEGWKDGRMEGWSVRTTRQSAGRRCDSFRASDLPAFSRSAATRFWTAVAEGRGVKRSAPATPLSMGLRGPNIEPVKEGRWARRKG